MHYDTSRSNVQRLLTLPISAPVVWHAISCSHERQPQRLARPRVRRPHARGPLPPCPPNSSHHTQGGAPVEFPQPDISEHRGSTPLFISGRHTVQVRARTTSPTFRRAHMYRARECKAISVEADSRTQLPYVVLTSPGRPMTDSERHFTLHTKPLRTPHPPQSL